MTTKKITPKTEEKIEKLELNPKVWGVEYNEDLVAQVLLVMRSNARQGDAHAKTRADVSGGGRKPWKQKGTGRARVGSNRSPLWNKGGVTFVPNFRNWAKKINKKMRKLSVAILLSKKLKDEKLQFVKVSVKEKSADTRKTFEKELLKGKNNLVVTQKEEIGLALRNMENVSVVAPTDLNALVLALAKNILVDNEAINVIEKGLLNEN